MILAFLLMFIIGLVSASKNVFDGSLLGSVYYIKKYILDR